MQPTELPVAVPYKQIRMLEAHPTNQSQARQPAPPEENMYSSSEKLASSRLADHERLREMATNLGRLREMAI